MTETEICNAALGRIGASTLLPNATVYDAAQAKELAVVTSAYGLTRDRLLRSHPWNFAMKRVVITKDATAPAFGWAYRFALPSDNLRVVKCNGHEVDEADRQWEVEGTWLLANEEEAAVTYVYRVTTTTLFDALFTQALIVLLASEIAGQLTRGADMRAGLLEEYERLVAPLARRVDANESSRRMKLPYFDSDLVRARMGF